MSEQQLRQLYADLQPGDRVEVVHHVKIGQREHTAQTVGVVVEKDRRECGLDSGFRRNHDDKYWFDHLLLQKADGELCSVTMDEYTEMRRVSAMADD